MVRIVQVIARLNRGGTARWIQLLTEELRSAGHEVMVISGHVGDNEIEDDSFSTLGAYRLDSLGRSVSLFADFKALAELREIIKNFNPDVVNTHTTKAGILGRLACLGLRQKVIHTYHGHLLYGYFNKTLTRLLILIERLMARITDSFISVGKQVRDDLISARIGEISRFNVIHPAVKDLEFISKDQARAKFGLSPDIKVVGWLGRLTEIKKPQRVIEISKEFPDVLFLIGGEGELKEKLDKNLPENVKLLGWCDPQVFWPVCDIALLTSENEGLPTSLIEAGFAHLPIISENVGSASEIFENEIGGILVLGFDERCKALRALLNHPAKISAMGKLNYEYAIKNFSVSEFVGRHIRAYVN